MPGRHDAACIGYYRAALALRPKSVPASVNLAGALHKGRNNTEAEECLLRALEQSPKAARWCAYNLGIFLMNDGRTDKAVGVFRQTIGIDPEYAPAHAALGHALLAEGQPAEARAPLQRALELLPPADPLRAQVERDLAAAAAVRDGSDRRDQD